MLAPESPDINGGTNGGTDGGSDRNAPTPPAGPPLTPWDGSWESPDPNQQGSGWETHWYFQQNRAVEAADVLAAAAALATTEDADHDSFHRILYTEFLEHYKTFHDALLAQEALATTPSDSNSDSISQGPADGALPGYMAWAQDYLEFILSLRDCATRRFLQGLPPAICSRNQPCDQCCRHDGFHVPSTYWHTLPPQELDLHVREYLRIRDELPPWRSRRTANPASPSLVSGSVAEQESPSSHAPASSAVPGHEADPAPAPPLTAPLMNSGVQGASAPSLLPGANATAAPAQNTSVPGDDFDDRPVFANVNAAERFLREAAFNLKRGPLVQELDRNADGPDDPPVFENVDAVERCLNERALNLKLVAHHPAGTFTTQTPDTAAAIGGFPGAGFASSLDDDVVGTAGTAATSQDPAGAVIGPSNPGVDGNFVSQSRSKRVALLRGPSIPAPATAAASIIHGWPEGVLAPVVAVNFGFMRESLAAATNAGRTSSLTGSDDGMPPLLEVSDSSPSESEDDDDVPALVDIAESSEDDDDDDDAPPLVDISESSASETEEDAGEVD